jgi:hypothetical protein
MDARLNRPWALLFEGCLHTLLDPGEPSERKADAADDMMNVAVYLDDKSEPFYLNGQPQYGADLAN